jgi:hypothetical protein
MHLLHNGDYEQRLECGIGCINDIHTIAGSYWRFFPTPSGDTLRVQRYRGPYGRFSISQGNRQLGKARMSGVLWSKTAAVEVAGNQRRMDDRDMKKVRTCKIPVGDYIPSLEVYMGQYHLSICDNIHVDGRPLGHMKRQRFHGIKIREDQPFTLDFSNQPDIFFALPGKDLHVKQGELLEVQAVLSDPVLDMIFADIEWGERRFKPPDSDEWLFGSLLDTINLDEDWHLPLMFLLFPAPACLCWLLSFVLKRKRRFFKIVSALFGCSAVLIALSYCRAGLDWEYDSLDPTVAILRSDGEVVASGIMPFG